MQNVNTHTQQMDVDNVKSPDMEDPESMFLMPVQNWEEG